MDRNARRAIVPLMIYVLAALPARQQETGTEDLMLIQYIKPDRIAGLR